MRLQGAAWETDQTSPPHMDSGQSANLQMTQLDVCILVCNHQLPCGFSKKGVDYILCTNRYYAFKIKWLQLATSLDCRDQSWHTGFAFVEQNTSKRTLKGISLSKWLSWGSKAALYSFICCTAKEEGRSWTVGPGHVCQLKLTLM